MRPTSLASSKQFFTTLVKNNLNNKSKSHHIPSSSGASTFQSIRSYLFQPTIPLQEKITVKVPSMGDSITEGTVVEWTAKVGQAVQVDDVIALIETDKVTVDIKAQVSGVIVKQFVSIDQDVEVGKELYVIDTEGQVDAAAAAATSSSGGGGEVVKGDVVEKTMQVDDHQSNDIGSGSGSGVRIPSIHFLGKKGWMEKRMVGATAASFADQQQQQQQQQEEAEEKAQVMLKPNAVTTIQADEPLPSNYGRLRLTEREMEDLGLGGAAEAPYSYK